MAEVNYNPHHLVDIKVDSTELVYGNYFFTEDDQDVEKLMPSSHQNKLKVVWDAEPQSYFLNGTLLSGPGLTWLASRYGQNLMTALFQTLDNAAQAGHEQIILIFKLSKEGWYFTNGLDYPSCIPGELVGIIEPEGYKIIDTEESDGRYEITVSWLN